jgi:protein involved in polysaccharide export with SLBB domain
MEIHNGGKGDCEEMLSPNRWRRFSKLIEDCGLRSTWIRRLPAGHIRITVLLLFAAQFVLLAAQPGLAQSINLTPEQRAMLDQLPPEQRQMALEQIEILRRSSGGESRSAETTETEPESPNLIEQLPDEGPFAPLEPRARENSRLVIDLMPDPFIPEEELAQIENDVVLNRLKGSRYYELDDFGVLQLPGLTPISLLGLTATQIERRIGAEPALELFDVTVTILDSEFADAEDIGPFGYEIFESEEPRFQPVMTGPVPPDYVLGPGDNIRVQLYGKENGIYEFEVTRDGILNLPQLGPITVAGLPFSEFREDLNRRVQQMLIGTQVSITMGQLRTIRVFVLGDVNRPGSYVVSSLATISSALYESGGISRIGSLRNIQLKRNGKTVAQLDLYDLLLSGDTSDDRKLQPGDVIFVPPVGPQVRVGGSVKRPAIYELRGETSVARVIQMAGGLTSDAFPSGARIQRIDGNEERKVVSIDASHADAKSLIARAGDALTIPRVLPRLEKTVGLAGHVHRPGPYQWHDGMRLTDILTSEAALKPAADSNYILIRREDPRTRQVSAISANLSAALDSPASAANVALKSRDTIYVFDLSFGRQRIVSPLLQELQLQARFGEPYREVSISGKVPAPGTFPLEPGMRVSDLLRAGGGLAEEAYALKAEVARYEVVAGEYRRTEVIDVDLDAILRGNAAADIPLREHDNLRISTIPDWDTLWTISLEGEVKFPGEYRIRRGETLREVVERAGGLTEAAFPEGAIFLRESLREREREQLEVLARRLEADLTTLSLQTLETTGSEALSTGQQLLQQLRSTQAVGRLVIDVEQITARTSGDTAVSNLELRDGDRLLIPKQAQEVTVIGETQQNTSHLYQSGLTRDDYIEMSGGLTRRADKKLIYVVRASGAVIAGSRSRWFGRSGNLEMRPGDTIVVPVDTDRVRPLTLWTNITQILYQASIAVAAIQSFN